jgi:hypothetical protein
VVKAATAIYDPTGHVVKQLVLDGDVEIERAIEAGDAKDTSAQQPHTQAVSRSVAITGDDGLVYLMRATSPATVYAISAAGGVVRKIVVDAPTGTGSPDFGIRVVKNRLVVQFRRSCDSTAIPTLAGVPRTPLSMPQQARNSLPMKRRRSGAKPRTA